MSLAQKAEARLREALGGATAANMSLEEAEATFGATDTMTLPGSAWLNPEGRFIPVRYHYDVAQRPDGGSISEFKTQTGSVRINALTFNLTFDWSGRLTRAQLDKLVELGANRLVTIDDGRTYRDLDAMPGPALRRVLTDPAGYSGPSLSQQFHTVGAKTASLGDDDAYALLDLAVSLGRDDSINQTSRSPEEVYREVASDAGMDPADPEMREVYSDIQSAYRDARAGRIASLHKGGGLIDRAIETFGVTTTIPRDASAYLLADGRVIPMPEEHSDIGALNTTLTSFCDET